MTKACVNTPQQVCNMESTNLAECFMSLLQKEGVANVTFCLL